MLGQLRSRIKATGPLTVADYMREALTHPQYGYYMKKEVFGRQGDFITSPEVSQTFGEVIGAWFLHHWHTNSRPAPVRLIELGPGRGTLASDLLRTFRAFDIKSNVHLHLVEISPHMRGRQWKALCEKDTAGKNLHGTGGIHVSSAELTSSTEVAGSPSDDKILEGEHESKFGVPVSWHTSLKDVPDGYSMIVGHEFLDALPVHQFKQTERGYREVLVDIDESDSGNPLRFVLARQSTPALAYLSKFHRSTGRENVEVCPQAGVVTEQICQRLVKNDGLSLLVDYGEAKPAKDFTFRAFREHTVQGDVLRDPGNVDLTADVDFSYICHLAQPHVQCLGPIPQGYFLHSLGIKDRANVILKNATLEERKELLKGLEYMSSPKKMGMRFKMLAMTQKGAVVPPPFVINGAGDGASSS